MYTPSLHMLLVHPIDPLSVYFLSIIFKRNHILINGQYNVSAVINFGEVEISYKTSCKMFSFFLIIMFMF